MKLLSLIGLFLISACSHPTYRSVASFDSQEMNLGTPEISRSIVKKFPPEIHQNRYRYYFYVELKDVDGEPVDVFNKEFKITNHQNKIVPHKLKRMLSGQYYLIVDQVKKLDSSQLKFYVGGKKLSQEFKLSYTEASAKNSHIKIVKLQRHRVKFLLTLRDANNKPVELHSAPEIILDANAVTEDIKYLKDGKWEFHIIYPEENQVLYISVRAQSAYFNKFFRYHYVER